MSNAIAHEGRRAEPSSVRLTPGFQTLATAAILVAALYVGRDVFVPLAIAVLLAFALVPIVRLLRRWHFGRVPSVIAAVLLSAIIIAGLTAIIGSQIAHLADDLPRYQYNIQQKISSFRGSAATGSVVERASSMLKNLGDEITNKSDPAELTRTPRGKLGKSAPGQPLAPVPVEIRQAQPAPLQVIQSIVTPLLQPLATTGIVVIFLIFILLAREDLRDRFIRLAGSADMHRTTAALDDAAQRLSRYLLMQTAINASFGVIIGVGLWLIGVPNPVLWGLLAAALRFIPYVGALIAAAFPAALALAVDPGWSMLLWTIGLFLVAEPITGQIVEPWLYGQTTGLSAVAIVVAAAFWTWLWGPVGLLLATPLTVCLVVLGRHVERLEFLEVMLGDRPALLPEESLYQRMLADDPDEAAEQAEEFLKEKPLAAFFDEVGGKALRLAQLDHNRGRLDHAGRARIKATVEGLLQDISEGDDADSSARTAPGTPAAVICIAGRGSLDEAAALMLAHLLEHRGATAQVISSGGSPELRAGDGLTPIVCACYLEPGTFSNARFLVRRLRRRLRGAPVMVALLAINWDEAAMQSAATATGADRVVSSFTGAVEAILSWRTEASAPPPPAMQAVAAE